MPSPLASLGVLSRAPLCNHPPDVTARWHAEPRSGSVACRRGDPYGGRVTLRPAEFTESRPGRSGVTLLKAADWAFTFLFLALLGLVFAVTCVGVRVSGKTGWPEAALVLVATFSTCFSLSRQLPGQNVMMSVVIIAVLGGLAHAAGALTSVPFGPFVYTGKAGPRLSHVLPWWIPFLWVVVLLNSRGVAKLILRPWRKTRSYGFRLLGVTVALCVVFDLGLEPFATRVGDFWLWLPTRLPLSWYSAPLTNTVGWAVASLLVLAFATPSLINKSPATPPRDLHPLVLWVALSLLFVAGSAAHYLWGATAVTGIAVSIVMVLAVRGYRW